MMKPQRKRLYFCLFTALFSIASLSTWLFLCACAAALLLAAYAVHEEQGADGTLSLRDAQKHAGQVATVLICLLPAFLLEWGVRRVYSYFLFQKIYEIYPAAVSFLPSYLRPESPEIQPAALFSLAFFSMLPNVVRFFLMPLVLHPVYLMLTAPRPLKELLQCAWKTWRARYGALLRRCVEYVLVQLAAVVVYIPFYMLYLGFFPYLYQNPFEFLLRLYAVVAAAFLQTFLFWRVLTVYTRAPAGAAAEEEPDEKGAPGQEELPGQEDPSEKEPLPEQERLPEQEELPEGQKLPEQKERLEQEAPPEREKRQSRNRYRIRNDRGGKLLENCRKRKLPENEAIINCDS